MLGIAGLGVFCLRLKKLHHLAVLWLTCVPAFASDDVAGMWSSQSRTKGGLGSQWVLSKDGQAAYTFGALVDFRYEVKGGRITMALLNSGQVATKEVLVDEFKIEGDTLTTNPNDPNKKQAMKRVGRHYPGRPHRGRMDLPTLRWRPGLYALFTSGCRAVERSLSVITWKISR